MNAPNSPLAEHRDIWELIPWFVTGRLSETDSKRTESHLRQCVACRDECIAQRQVHQAMRADAGVEQLPVAGLNRLRQRIEALDASSAELRSAPSVQAGRACERRGPVRRLSLAASVVALAVSLAALGTLVWKPAWRGPSGAYSTVTTPAPQTPHAAIRAVFAPSVRLSELQTMLADAQLKIVSGPTEAGVYSLAITGPRSMNWSLERLRGNDAVRFAEAIARSADSPATPP